MGDQVISNLVFLNLKLDDSTFILVTDEDLFKNQSDMFILKIALFKTVF